MYFLYGLCILLIGLKLTSVVSVSWWVITSPLWGYALFIMFVFVLAFILSIWNQQK